MREPTAVGTGSAIKPFVEFRTHIPPASATSVWGLFFGIVFGTFGTVAAYNWTGFERYVIAVPMALVGYLAVFGAIGASRIERTVNGFVLSYRLLGVVPIFRRTLVKQHEILGLRHICRQGTFVNLEGERLDEHFIVIATQHPKEYVACNLGAHPSAQAQAVKMQAQVWAKQQNLPLSHEFDGP